MPGSVQTTMALDSFSSCSMMEGTNANYVPLRGRGLAGFLKGFGSGTFCEGPFEAQISNISLKARRVLDSMDEVIHEVESMCRKCQGIIDELAKCSTETASVLNYPSTAVGFLEKQVETFSLPETLVPLVIDLSIEGSSDSGPSTRRLDREPEESEQGHAQSLLSASVATGISKIFSPPLSPPSLKCRHPDFVTTQGGSPAAVNKPQEITIISDDDDDDDDQSCMNKLFVSGKAVVRENVNENARSRPSPSPSSLPRQHSDPAVNKPQEITILSDDDDDDKRCQSEHFGFISRFNYEAAIGAKVYENVRSPPPLTPPSLTWQHPNSAETQGGSAVVDNPREITMCSVDDDDDKSSEWEHSARRIVNASYVKPVDENEDSFADTRQKLEYDNRNAGHERSSSSPLVENVRPLLTFKRRKVNINGDGVWGRGNKHPTIHFVEQQKELMQVEPNFSKIPRRPRARRQRRPRENPGKRKAKELEELVEDDVDEEEDEQCGKGRDIDPTEEELRKLADKVNDEVVVYEPYVQKIYQKENEVSEDDFSMLKTFITTFSGPSSDKSVTKSTLEGQRACNHRNFDLDGCIGYYCVDCGAIGLDMPTSSSNEQSRICAHQKRDYTDEAGYFCEDCGKVWQDIQSIYITLDKEKALRKQAPKVQEHIHEVSHIQFNLQGSSSNNDDFCGADLQLHPFFDHTLLPHQKKGFKFLTKHLLGDQESHKSKGCVLGHAPGTGKTLLVTSFINSFLTRFAEGKPLILAPSIMLRSWENEFEKWKVQEIPIYRIDGSAPDAFPADRGLEENEDEDEEDAKLAPHVKTPLKESRALKLREWQKGRGVLLMSYTLFAMMVKNGLRDHVHEDSLDYRMSKVLRDSPNLVILDEGHIARNTNTGITKALLALVTKRIVLLSGTLFQNNFKELYTLLKLCRHDFMISHPHYGKRILECAANNRGLKDSNGISFVEKKTKEELMRIEEKIFTEEIGDRLENYVKSCETRTDEIQSVAMKLQSLTSSFVDWYPGEILKSLPGLIEYSIHLDLTESQQDAIRNLPNLDQKNGYMTRQHRETAACIHPSLVSDKGENTCLQSPTVNTSSLRDEAHKGVKITFILRLMASCTLARERLLIFCSILRPLTYLEDIFSNVMPGWRKGQQILRLDGNMADSDRQRVIRMFNDMDSSSQVLLASTKCCKEGITLVGASRVVILDNLDNPSIIRQAVSRAYRIGQKKKVYVYRLVTTHRSEEQVFRRSVNKERLSQVLLDPVATMSRFGNFLQPQKISDIEDDLLKKLMITDRDNGRQIDVVSKYNAVG